MMIVIGYNEQGGILVEIEGATLTVPDDPENRDRKAVKDWENLGNTIPQYIVVVTAEQVNAERDRRLIAGTTVEVDGLGRIALQGRDRDQTNMLGLKDAARDLRDAGVTEPVMVFRDASDVSHDLTPAQLIDMVSKGMAWFSATYQASWAIKALDPIPKNYRDDSFWH